ncbi:hypothetical protein GALL_273850 [mine drainage metagenome]|uniref:Uncharacterized protein n=1 Tax=mine drainage metagenome TaxID=410659 RepID=A0A1J5R469_9ZZZZ
MLPDRQGMTELCSPPPDRLARSIANPPDSGVLCVAQDRLAPGTHALVRAVGTERREDDQLPDRAAVLGRVEAVTTLPVAVAQLRREDPGHHAPGHDRVFRREGLRSVSRHPGEVQTSRTE